MSDLLLKGIKKSYGPISILHGVDLSIKRGEFIVFVGPSGCGKSTLLRVIAGLETITAGTLQIDGEVVNTVPPSQRGIAMVFQSYALYPHMTVRENMSFSMRIANRSKADIEEAIQKAARILRLEPYLDRLPKALSGGQRQRVAIGRAIVRNPKVFLFDEPLSNLDAALRVATRIEIAQLKKSMPDTTMIYVTHDQVEAMTLADRIVVLNAGRIEQHGAPLELYNKPNNIFVARFIGSPAMNILPARVIEHKEVWHTLELPFDGRLNVALKTRLEVGTKVQLGVRPEDMMVAKAGRTDTIFKAPVKISEALGESTVLYFHRSDQEEPLIAKLSGHHEHKPDEILHMIAPSDKLHVFDQNGLAVR